MSCKTILSISQDVPKNPKNKSALKDYHFRFSDIFAKDLSLETFRNVNNPNPNLLKKFSKIGRIEKTKFKLGSRLSTSAFDTFAWLNFLYSL